MTDGRRMFMKKNDVARLADGAIVGSLLTMAQAAANLHRIGVSLPQLGKILSLNACRMLGVADRYGSLAPGEKALLTVLDEDFSTRI